MKVAYNNCYGGFSLSPIAETEYRKKKGINLVWYIGVGDYPYKIYKKVYDIENYEKYNDISIFALIASIEDLGEEVEEIPDKKQFYESWHGDTNRNDPDLIEIIERLGKKANGSCANIAIKEIPDGAEYEITEYDGNEEVLPPRQSW